MPAKKRPARRVAVKRDPLLLGEEPLAFDEVTEEELLELSPQEEADLFMSTWIETMRPFTLYRRYFARPDVNQPAVLGHVKNFYTRFVTEGGWSDDKYLVSLDAVLVAGAPLSLKTLEAKGPLYDQERLPMQLREKSAQRRQRRAQP